LFAEGLLELDFGPMLQPLHRVVLQALLAQAPDSYVKPVSAMDPAYFELLEKNTHFIYPALAILVLVLLVAGILQAWRTQDLDGLQKAELKREVILVLRRETHGAEAELLAREIGMAVLKLVKILEELQHDGIVVSVTNTQRKTFWSLKGINPGHRRREK